MENFPIFIDIGSKPVIVVGGGTIALRKVILLSKAKPKITVISENICLELRELLKKHRGKFIKKSFSEKDIKNPILIIEDMSLKKLTKSINPTSLVVSYLPVDKSDGSPVNCILQYEFNIDE